MFHARPASFWLHPGPLGWLTSKLISSDIPTFPHWAGTTIGVVWRGVHVGSSVDCGTTTGKMAIPATLVDEPGVGTHRARRCKAVLKIEVKSPVPENQVIEVLVVRTRCPKLENAAPVLEDDVVGDGRGIICYSAWCVSGTDGDAAIAIAHDSVVNDDYIVGSVPQRDAPALRTEHEVIPNASAQVRMVDAVDLIARDGNIRDVVYNIRDDVIIVCGKTAVLDS